MQILTTRLRVSVGIASTGRAELVRQIVATICDQTHPPDEIIICGADQRDLPDPAMMPPELSVRMLLTGRGLTRQRNAIISASMASDILLFIDDDFIMHPKYVEHCVAAFATHDNLVLVTGKLAANGAVLGSIPFSDGKRLAYAAKPEIGAVPIISAYGCNMAVAMRVVREQNIRFDEQLPLYGWLEDRDFSRQLSSHGALKRLVSCIGVHLGHSAGRVSGTRYGYSQIANPLYLVRKGTMECRAAMFLMARNVLANAVNSLKRETTVDRRGRLQGNLLAFIDLLAGRLHPIRVEQIS